jgi:CubicO group peptidase (beta-lactamase class C family)
MRFLLFVRVFLIIVFFLGGIIIPFKNEAWKDVAAREESVGTGPVNELNDLSISHQLRNADSYFPGSEEFDDAVMALLKRYGVKGASLAIAREGRLIYARGYGWADVSRDESMEPYHLLRIASVSKLITATAIMKLVDEGKLSLDSKVFGIDGILNDSIYRAYRDKRYERITVQQLLNHTSGWSRKNGDPVFQSIQVAADMHVPLPVDIPTTIRYALKRPLSYPPGSRYSYSNLAYLVLGQIIEKLTGKCYEGYVQDEILHPLGIYDMHIGRSFRSERFWNESSYYESTHAPLCKAYDGSDISVPRAYGANNMTLLGAAGGWVASPAELLKLVLAVDGYDNTPDIISSLSFMKMSTLDPKTHSLFGWVGTDMHGNLWRTGTLAGTSALVMRRNNNIDWVLLLNSSPNRSTGIHHAMANTILQALGSVEAWPAHDLFALKKMETAKPISVQMIH